MHQIRNESDRLCREHGLSVITLGQDRGKKYAEWDTERKGYEQWAKIHNLKQAAKTLNFLTEHDISDYEQLQAVLDEVHIEEMERVYSGIRSMKHDMKNMLSVVLRL